RRRGGRHRAGPHQRGQAKPDDHGGRRQCTRRRRADDGTHDRHGLCGRPVSGGSPRPAGRRTRQTVRARAAGGRRRVTFAELPGWVRAPATARVLAALVAIAVIAVFARMARAAIINRVSDMDTRYRAVKVVRFVAFFVAAIALATIFSQRLASFTVAFGVAGAGVAFALQEVIASVAGWLAVLSGGFYKTGDRVQLGGIKGDVIDIGVLRTTLMECGQWVDGDLYNGRIVKVANSFVFKEPVVNYAGDFSFLWD